jgi:hypothetical protein
LFNVVAPCVIIFEPMDDLPRGQCAFAARRAFAARFYFEKMQQPSE